MIQKMLDLSTAHITENTADALNEGYDFNLVIYPKAEYGWFIHVPDEEFFEDEEKVFDLPTDLVRLIDIARVKECTWIMLDRDGSIHDNLPTYIW